MDLTQFGHDHHRLLPAVLNVIRDIYRSRAMNYWIPWLWQDGFERVTQSELAVYGDQWTLNFNYSSLSDQVSYEEQGRGWRVYESWTWGSFCCSRCSREWESASAELLFRYRLRRQSAASDSGRGTVLMRPRGQRCRRCGTSVLPGFSGGDADGALEELAAEMRTHCYSEEDEEDDGPSLSTYDHVVSCRGYARARDKLGYVASHLAVTDSMKHWIERQTVGQSTNSLWSAYRKNRITSSHFGEVLAAVRRRSHPPSLFRALLGQDDLSRVQAVQWGIRNEPVAKEEYMRRTGLRIQERGVFLSRSGLLGASPDGTVCGGDRIVEVKCPYAARDMTVSQAAAHIGGFCLEFIDERRRRVLALKPDHHYWHQIQGALHLSGADGCDLVVWTPRDLVVLPVDKDPTWAAANVGILETFYTEVFLPHVLSQG